MFSTPWRRALVSVAPASWEDVKEQGRVYAIFEDDEFDSRDLNFIFKSLLGPLKHGEDLIAVQIHTLNGYYVLTHADLETTVHEVRELVRSKYVQLYPDAEYCPIDLIACHGCSSTSKSFLLRDLSEILDDASPRVVMNMNMTFIV